MKAFIAAVIELLLGFLIKLKRMDLDAEDRAEVYRDIAQRAEDAEASIRRGEDAARAEAAFEAALAKRFPK